MHSINHVFKKIGKPRYYNKMSKEVLCDVPTASWRRPYQNVRSLDFARTIGKQWASQQADVRNCHFKVEA